MRERTSEEQTLAFRHFSCRGFAHLGLETTRPLLHQLGYDYWSRLCWPAHDTLNREATTPSLPLFSFVLPFPPLLIKTPTCSDTLRRSLWHYISLPPSQATSSWMTDFPCTSLCLSIIGFLGSRQTNLGSVLTIVNNIVLYPLKLLTE